MLVIAASGLTPCPATDLVGQEIGRVDATCTPGVDINRHHASLPRRILGDAPSPVNATDKYPAGTARWMEHRGICRRLSQPASGFGGWRCRAFGSAFSTAPAGAGRAAARSSAFASRAARRARSQAGPGPAADPGPSWGLSLRQWVLTVPFDLRLLLARNAAAFGATCRIQAEELLASYECRARQAGIGKQRGEIVRGAGVSFPQRFGGSLNLNTHNHGAFVDGVFVIERGSTPGAERSARFHQLPPPERDEMDAVCDRIAVRFLRWLERRSLLAVEPDHFNNEAPEQSALGSCSQLSLGIGVLTSVPGENAPPADADEQAELEKLKPARGRRSRYLGEAQGFGLHAAVCVPAGNNFGRELLLRYCGRPPFSLECLSLLPSGHVAYQIKSPWRSDQTHRVMEPREFLARLAALVPPPRTPLVRFHGAIAPNFPPGHRRRAGAERRRRAESAVVLDRAHQARSQAPGRSTARALHASAHKDRGEQCRAQRHHDGRMFAATANSRPQRLRRGAHLSCRIRLRPPPHLRERHLSHRLGHPSSPRPRHRRPRLPLRRPPPLHRPRYRARRSAHNPRRAAPPSDPARHPRGQLFNPRSVTIAALRSSARFNAGRAARRSAYATKAGRASIVPNCIM